jgi:hypothetical protein
VTREHDGVNDGPCAAQDLTSFHVLRSEQGNTASLEWVVQRFSPLLLAQAEFRLGPRLPASVFEEL